VSSSGRCLFKWCVSVLLHSTECVWPAIIFDINTDATLMLMITLLNWQNVTLFTLSKMSFKQDCNRRQQLC